MPSKSSHLVPGTLVRIGRELDAVLSPIVRTVKSPLQALSFWGAIGLPFAQIGLLANGLETASATLTFVGLLALNVAALYVGHGHKQR
ncbi:hypothetical protein [Halovivax cerinus]|uniref:Uncharacterized protein n=1 Tax=Halovivax cerinus TaxID=1487865 RepID=A0ABD5NSP0_9EURY|nr:hypothetical protein [Halovivax cerinus]